VDTGARLYVGTFIIIPRSVPHVIRNVSDKHCKIYHNIFGSSVFCVLCERPDAVGALLCRLYKKRLTASVSNAAFSALV
jgi:hypothetical protein